MLHTFFSKKLNWKGAYTKSGLSKCHEMKIKNKDIKQHS